MADAAAGPGRDDRLRSGGRSPANRGGRLRPPPGPTDRPRDAVLAAGECGLTTLRRRYDLSSPQRDATMISRSAERERRAASVEPALGPGEAPAHAIRWDVDGLGPLRKG